MIGTFVVCRTQMAGVHCGIVAAMSADGKRVRLSDARRIWRWRGANTLNEVATRGVSMDFTRISTPVTMIVLSEVCETIATSSVAQENLRQSRWGT